VAYPCAVFEAAAVQGPPVAARAAGQHSTSSRAGQAACAPHGTLMLFIMCAVAHTTQTWLDERLFGWSSSSTRGTSAWAGRSNEPSTAPTPEESESEDEGDYDNVLGYLPGIEGGTESPTRVRSRAGSYNDLQKLRMNKLTPAAPTSEQLSPTSAGVGSLTDGLRTRHARKNSLTEDFSVERIGAFDREKPLQNVTDDLNREAGKSAPL
jgi:hypothetical protein